MSGMLDYWPAFLIGTSVVVTAFWVAFLVWIIFQII